jgi:hypothetical protein
VRRTYLVGVAAAAILAASSFLPWLRLGSLPLAGIPDPAGYFVLGAGAIGALASAAGLVTRRDVRQALVLAGLAALTTLVVVWMTGPATIADRAQARAEAVAIVDNVPAATVPAVTVGFGLIVGIGAAVVLTAAGLQGVLRRTPADTSHRRHIGRS